jgi:hypothetical protein
MWFVNGNGVKISSFHESVGETTRSFDLYGVLAIGGGIGDGLFHTRF